MSNKIPNIRAFEKWYLESIKTMKNPMSNQITEMSDARPSLGIEKLDTKRWDTTRFKTADEEMVDKVNEIIDVLNSL